PHRSSPYPALRSFPTRRSSDLMGYSRIRLTGNNRTSRKKLRSLFLDNSITLTGQKRLIDLKHPIHNDRIITDLITAGKHHQIILDRKSTRLNSSHVSISYAVFC